MIELAGVTSPYETGAGTVTALADVDVDAGEFVVVLGPSGSGRVTLLNIIGALDTPTSGTAASRRPRPGRRLAVPTCSAPQARR
ncbi:MAG: ATP-binding cassette domain-containing protein [Acidimicrobiales bacterium]